MKLNRLHTALPTFIVGALSAALLAGVSTSAQATLFQIDISQSHVTHSNSGLIFCDPNFNCSQPQPQTFSLSGILDVSVRRESFGVSFFPTITTIELNLIDLRPVSLNLGGAESLGFAFPGFPGTLTGQSFSGSGNPCSLFFMQGSTCMSMGPFGGFGGTYDGSTLTLDGDEPNGYFENFTYRIVANALTVPEPGTLALTALAGLAAISRRRNL